MPTTSFLRYRIVPIIFVLLSLVFIGISLFNKNFELTIKVSPTKNNLLFKQPISNYGSYSVFADGILKIKSPSFIQRIFYPDIEDFDMLMNLIILIVAVSLLFLSIKFNPSAPFRNNIDKYLSIIGFAFIGYFILNKLRLYLISDTILAITNDEFKIPMNPITEAFSVWAGIITLWVRFILKRGFLLQHEQDLTI